MEASTDQHIVFLTREPMENIKRVKTISETHLDPVKYSELPDEALVHMLRAYTIVEASCHLTGHESGELVYIKQRLRNINAELLSRGVVTDEGSSLIEKEFVRNFLESPKWSPDKYNSVRHIFITLDPNCSNSPTSSDMAMVAVAPVGLQRVIVGIDSHAVGTASQAIQLLKEFVTGLRRVEAFQSAWLVLCVERNTGHESGYLSDEFLKFSKTVAIAQHETKDYGWWTDHALKLKAAYKLRKSMAEGSLVLMKDFVCSNPWIPAEKRREKTMNKFVEQIKRYKLVENERSTPHANTKVTVSGKVDKDGKISGTFKDDIITMLGINLHLWDKLILREIPTFDYASVFNQK